MNQAEFEKKCKEPVDLDACGDALQRLINREHTLHVPARPDDEDMLISRALRELKEIREENENLKTALVYIENESCSEDACITQINGIARDVLGY